jgi:nucleotide-binding universal stress UspA family protein
MQAKLIVFPTDFSSASDAAMHYATSLARDAGAKLLIVHVEEPPLAYGGGELYYGIPDPDRGDLTKMLDELTPSDPAVPYEHRMLLGEPATEIVRLAEEQSADLIVMGTHGRTGLKRLLMGSVAEAVVRRSACPVLTFKEPRHAAATK